MTAPDTDQLVLVGRVIATHGIRGELKVLTESDEPERLVGLRTVRIGAAVDSARELAVESARIQILKRGKALLLRLEQVDSMEAAAALDGYQVYALQEALELEADEHFVHDLVGAQVDLEDGRPLGTVADILQSSAQDVLVIRRPDAPDALVPFVKEFVLAVHVEDARIVIRPIAGLID